MKFLLSLIFLCMAGSAYSQNAEKSYIGIIKINGFDENYAYKLKFKNTNGIIKGYSITDVAGEDETKATIDGSIDTVNNTVTFRETHIIVTKSQTHNNDFCFIHVTLKISKENTMTKLNGHFIGYREDGVTECGKGELQLWNTKRLPNKVDVIAASLDTTEHKQEMKYQHISPGETKTLALNDTTVTIEIWDNKNVDGDIVDVYYNDKILLADYSIINTHKILQVTIDKIGNNVLRIVCVSEGTEPTNTARLKIISGNAIYTIDAVTVMGKDVFVKLKVK